MPADETTDAEIPPSGPNLGSSMELAKAEAFGETLPPAVAPEAAEIPIPAEIGSYALLDKLGEGGRGMVYRARDMSSGEIVALKLQRNTAEHPASFQHEYDMMHQVWGPLLLAPRCFYERPPFTFVAMDFVEGRSLDQVLRDKPGPTVVERLEIIIQALKGLDALHEGGVIHCDVKPGNLMVVPGEKPTAKLIDYGIAIFANEPPVETKIIGTVDYMSREQLAGERLTVATDIYSAGVMLYVMLTGHVPFGEGKSERQAVIYEISTAETPSLKKHLGEPPPGLVGILDQLDWVLGRALSKEPEKRFDSAAKFATILEGMLWRITPQATEWFAARLAEATKGKEERAMGFTELIDSITNPKPPLTHVGRFQILRLLDNGGFVDTYLARDPLLEVEVVVTVSKGTATPEAQSYLLNGARALTRLDHPNIVQFKSYDEDKQGHVYLVTEYLKGNTLADVLKDWANQPSLAQRLDWIRQMCDALYHAHTRIPHAVLHRDVKPSKIALLADNKTAKLQGFVVASLAGADLSREDKTRTVEVFPGTLSYIAPERVRGEVNIDGRSDIFSLGVVLYEAIAGARPWTGPDEMGVMVAMMNEPFAPLSTYVKEYPRELDGILQKALANDRNKRYATAAEMSRDLAALLAKLGRGTAPIEAARVRPPDEPPFYAYMGTDPFLFVSYSHKDSAQVYPAIDELHQMGFRIWYDEGIDPGNEWPDEVAKALKGCSYFVVFISGRSVESRNVKNEINMALNRGKPFLAIHLEETELPTSLELRMGDIQAVMSWRMPKEMYLRKMERALPETLKGSGAVV